MPILLVFCCQSIRDEAHHEDPSAQKKVHSLTNRHFCIGKSLKCHARCDLSKKLLHASETMSNFLVDQDFKRQKKKKCLFHYYLLTKDCFHFKSSIVRPGFVDPMKEGRIQFSVELVFFLTRFYSTTANLSFHCRRRFLNSSGKVFTSRHLKKRNEMKILFVIFKLNQSRQIGHETIHNLRWMFKISSFTVAVHCLP